MSLRLSVHLYTILPAILSSPACQRRLALRADLGDGPPAQLGLGESMPQGSRQAGSGAGSRSRWRAARMPKHMEDTAMMPGRRSCMITGAADVGAGGGAAWAADTPIRYPDPHIKVLDPRFQPYVLGNAAIERLAGGCRFTEGPVWFGDGRYLLWSDIPNDRLVKWEEETGAISVFRRPAHYANGNTRDHQGRLLTCEMDAQRLPSTAYDGTITVLAESFEGKRLTSPNDVVVTSDGSIWFSDNGAGTRGHYLGHKAPWELPFRVYRLDPGTGALTVVVDDMRRPNGLAFSPDETRLYVVDTPGPGQRTIQVYDVVAQGTKVANRREFCSAEPGGKIGRASCR